MLFAISFVSAAPLVKIETDIHQVLQSWTSQGKNGVTKTAKDTMTLALHVLIAGGLGKSYSFSGGVGTLAEGHTMSYRDALKIILMNLTPAVILASLPPIPSSILTKRMNEVNSAVGEFRSHMNQMIEEERVRVDKLDSEKDNLLTALVRASDAASQGKERSGLSHDEIMGNLFIYNLAGHDTTANTICYAIYLLAAQPEYQAWLREEIGSVFQGNDKVETWEYEKAFPKLKRCLALMVCLFSCPAASAPDTHSTRLFVYTHLSSLFRDTLVRNLRL